VPYEGLGVTRFVLSVAHHSEEGADTGKECHLKPFELNTHYPNTLLLVGNFHV